mmetsp:Transcript_28355/g.30520  ORF Transcript_28355/g.30520 Transcript_28355/m.30520 type:complete len:84 (+) Transcript_28355:1013-1264(+)
MAIHDSTTSNNNINNNNNSNMNMNMNSIMKGIGLYFDLLCASSLLPSPSPFTSSAVSALLLCYLQGSTRRGDCVSSCWLWLLL